MRLGPSDPRPLTIGADDAGPDDRDAGVCGGSLRAVVSAPAVDAKCGDWRVLKVNVVFGRSPFLESIASMTTP